MSIETITPQQLHSRYTADSTIHVLDVRSPAEFETVHAVMAKNVPLDQLDAAKYLSACDAQTLYVICKSGGRSSKACDKLAAVGRENLAIVNVAGGTDAWDAANLPVTRGKETISIDRQVRITAGSIVVIGAALSWFHPAFVLISAFIGAGLVFAGVTNTCGMAVMLARMPWNQVKQSPSKNSPSSSARSMQVASCDTGSGG